MRVQKSDTMMELENIKISLIDQIERILPWTLKRSPKIIIMKEDARREDEEII